jgi:MraZ protein
MFIGEYVHNLDEKGRLAIPVKFRRDLVEGAVITRGVDKCLFLYSKNEWTKLAKKLTHLSINQAKNRAFSRLMLAGAAEADLDNQGRVSLPQHLKEYAGLNKKVVVAGLYDRIEIWNEEAWNEFKTQTEKESENIAEQLGELGF